MDKMCLPHNITNSATAGAFAYYLQFGEIFEGSDEQIDKINEYYTKINAEKAVEE
jgi:hypothetical protein